MAELFAKEGATVYSADVLEAADAEGSPVEFAIMDITKADEWSALVDRIVAEHGRIDILVNNAAIVDYSPILDTSEELYDRVLDIDLKSIFLGMKTVLPHMIAQQAGSIVNVSSIWGMAGVPSSYAYQAAKGAILNVSKNVAAAHGLDGVRCNSLHPGYILSPMNEHQADDINKALIDGTVLGRPGVPAETAYATLFLASDEASYVTGTSLVVDGGFLAK
ncbi:SDR family NAD(P)-dependent oxidoreductase [Homoserinibacter sp. YIM 151385]|uniref:SDR family NAD(P)-dependent oxidoreductase n=1 Tax=Homoserinibacter sp. YIM 151385 TaxID=2985506 RepID=UPI0022F12382|nr:SDR family oxidoreductase [Homoserinibacter sp. YIM 151385]WBU37473.1 SDR family oxidoreductase [Homoserinibacter sp. YIM 151385]